MLLWAADASLAHAEGSDLGLMIEAGLPDGINGALVWRPSPRIRAHGGAGFNGVAPGLRAGVSVAAFPYWITPTLSAEVGHYFAGNANTLGQKLSGDPEFDQPVLREFGYDYVNASLGLELGYSGMTFYIHAGMSGVQTRLRNVDESLASDSEGIMGPRIEVRSDPLVRVLAPSARTGFIYYF